MTPAEHYAEAERLIVVDDIHEPPTSGNIALAQVHALLALYRPDDPTGCLWERPADDPAPVPEGCEGMRAGRRWPQDHAQDVTVVGEVLTAEPGPEVIQVVDRDGKLWTRKGVMWVHYGDDEITGASGWYALAEMRGPLRIGAVR